MWKKFEIYSIKKNCFGHKMPCVLRYFVPRGFFSIEGGRVLNSKGSIVPVTSQPETEEFFLVQCTPWPHIDFVGAFLYDQFHVRCIFVFRFSLIRVLECIIPETLWIPKKNIVQLKSCHCVNNYPHKVKARYGK